MNEPVTDLLRRALAIRRDGRAVAACLLVKARGSTPQAAGALMLVDDRANTWGTIGGGCVEAEIRQRVLPMLASGASALLRFKLDHDYGWDDGLLCGGSIELAVAPLPDAARLEGIVGDVDARRETALELQVETDDGLVRYGLRLPPRERLYVAGAGHVGQAVARLAVRLDFDVSLFDDRVDMLERFAPDDARAVAGPIAERLAAAPVDEATYCVIVTRGHRHDGQALEAMVGRGARFVGMIGSRRKAKVIYEELAAKGVAAADLDAVITPIGIDIGSESVEEIAVSIAAQLVEVRCLRSRSVIDGPHPERPVRGVPS